MAKPTKSCKTGSGYILGRQNFAKISAVEGIRLSRQMNKDFDEFDRRALSPKARRDVLSGKYGAKS